MGSSRFAGPPCFCGCTGLILSSMLLSLYIEKEYTVISIYGNSIEVLVLRAENPDWNGVDGGGCYVLSI